MEAIYQLTLGDDTEAAGPTIDDDGNVIGPDGEVLGNVGVERAWRPQASKDVEYALERRSRIEGRLADIRSRKKAMIRNFDAMEKAELRELGWWDWRFRADLIAFARRVLEGGKRKTAQFEFGAIRFRQSAGTNEIVDMDAACDFVAAVRPEAVKVERSVPVKAVLEVVRRLEEGGEVLSLHGILKSSGPRETVTIDTGVDL